MTARRTLGLHVKHGVDRISAALMLLVLSPLMVLIALLIKLGAKGPVFFRHERVGYKGRTFQIRKFRSMVPDAVEKAGGHVTRLDSPLVTPFGRFLRLTSLDELPQFINVLKGEMSLVGPRPLLPGSIRESEIRRQDMRPGCTGLAIVSGRQSLDWDRRLELDLWYVDHWSLLLDFQILLRTVPAVLLAKNVYDAKGEMKARTETKRDAVR